MKLELDQMAEIVNILLTVIGIALSLYLAKTYGDRAGTQAAIKYEEEKEQRERIAALQALLNQVSLTENLARLNSQQGSAKNPSNIVLARLPVQAFETAFVSGGPPLSSHPELLEAVMEYLSEAYFINAAIDKHLSVMSSPGSQSNYSINAINKAVEKCKNLHDVLGKLDNALRENLEMG